MQIKKRKQAFLFFACRTLIKFMQPECLNFFMLQLKGKVNSKTRRSVLGLKHNFRGIQLYNSDSNVQLFYRFLAIRAKIGAFGLHFFGGIKIM